MLTNHQASFLQVRELSFLPLGGMGGGKGKRLLGNFGIPLAAVVKFCVPLDLE